MRRGRFFEAWSSLALTLLTLLANGLSQILVLICAVLLLRPVTPSDVPRFQKLAEGLLWDGTVFPMLVIVSAVAGVVVTFLWVRWFREEPAGRYLALSTRPGARDWVWGAALLAVYAVGVQVLLPEAQERETPEYMVRVVQSALHRPLGVALAVLAIAVAGPLFEEVAFRGFLYRGLASGLRSAFGERARRAAPAIAILVTSAAWSSIHFQYAELEVLQIFGLGLALGLARLMTGGLWVPLAMHAFVNLAAMYFVVAELRGWPAGG